MLMASKSKLEQMEMMYNMCRQEVEQLRCSLSRFLLDNVPQDHSSVLSRTKGEATPEKASDMDENVFALMAYDRYMSQLSAVANMARKFNIQMQFSNNNNNKSLCAIGSEMTPTYLLKEFVQWNNNVKGKDEVFEMDLDLKSVGSSFGSDSFQKQQHIAIEQSAAQNNGYGANGMLAEIAQSPPFRKVHFDSPQSIVLDGTVSCVPLKNLTCFGSGYKFSATITHIVDLERLIFYICQMGNDDLYELSNMHSLPKCVRLPPSNTVFGVSINNKNILRAVLKASSDDDDDDPGMRLLLIDYGEVISLDDHCELYHVPSKFHKIPAQAIKCILVGRYSDRDVDENDPNFLAAGLLKNESKEVTFEVVRNLGRVLYLRMYEKWKPTESSPNISKNPFLNECKDVCEELTVNIPPISPPVVSGTSSKSVCEVSKEESDVNFAKNNSDTIAITVTHIAGVDSFYGQMTEEEDKKLDPLFWADDELEPDQKLSRLPQINELVLAQYAIDGFWYRAVVVEADENEDIFKVFYVDYGNKETVTLSCLANCMLSEEVEPFRSIYCRLADVCDNTGDSNIFSQQAIETLVVMLLNQTVHVEIVSKSKNQKELLVRFLDEEFKNVPQLLLNMGYVREVENGIASV